MEGLNITSLSMVDRQLDLLTTPILKTANICVNTECNVFVCCGSFQGMTTLLNHISDKHKKEMTMALKNELTKVADHFNVKGLPAIKPNILARPELAGLKVQKNMHACSLCGYTAGKKPVETHISGNPQWTAQALNKGLASAYIRVIPRGAAAGDEAPCTLVDDLNHSTGKQGKRKANDAQEIRKFVEHPKETEEHGWVLAMVQTYFKDATALIHGTPELVLQQLNSPDPVKDTNETRTKYANLIISLITSLLQTTDAFTYPMSAALRTALAEIETAGIHPVFRALWMTTWMATNKCSMPDPTMCFLMLDSIQKTGDLRTAKQTSQSLSSFTRAIRLACLMEGHEMVKHGESPAITDSIKTVIQWSISCQTPSLPCIWWLDMENWTRLQYEGDKVSLDHLHKIFENMETQLVDMWENKVLLKLGLHVGFFDDERNPFVADEHTLLEEIFGSLELKQEFTTESGELDLRRCRKWLQDLAAFEELLMVALGMCSGAPPRGTELTNTMGLNAFTADLLVQLHALARPLAHVFASKCMPDLPGSVFNYTHLLFTGAGKRKHILYSLDSPEVEVNTQQSGHSRHIENMVYGLSPDSLLAVSEDRLLVFIKPSIQYQKMMKLVPGGQTRQVESLEKTVWRLEMEASEQKQSLAKMQGTMSNVEALLNRIVIHSLPTLGNTEVAAPPQAVEEGLDADNHSDFIGPKDIDGGPITGTAPLIPAVLTPAPLIPSLLIVPTAPPVPTFKAISAVEVIDLSLSDDDEEETIINALSGWHALQLY
ncbi:hypothetical protein GGX14DRAFT_404703 [Mycena pura]|uniref:C2H2-type domain-containing protein n=1 Tax=Mycena pura TaxID=153505 RepID=A0AAD6UX64_9AGAR|nr:hypothetical protein GGX14DRAFT_404703 [Mycena pura]